MSYFERETDRAAKQTSKTPSEASQTTAYQSNTRNGSGQAPVQYSQNNKIKVLLEQDYAFLPSSYRAPGFLFRGLESGISHSIREGQFTLNDGSHSLAALERELDVVLVSADFSDALSVSRLWEFNEDGGILVIPANVFDQRYAQHDAATLGFAEPGVVFKYPFFANPIPIHHVAHLIIHKKQVDTLINAVANGAHSLSPTNNTSAFPADSFMTVEDFSQGLIVIDDDSSLANRSLLNEYLNECLAEKNISKATAIQVEGYPTK